MLLCVPKPEEDLYFPECADLNAITHNFIKGAATQGIVLGALRAVAFAGVAGITAAALPEITVACVAAGVAEVIFGENVDAAVKTAVENEIKKLTGDLATDKNMLERFGVTQQKLDGINDNLVLLHTKLNKMQDEQVFQATCAGVVTACDMLEQMFPASKTARTVSRFGKAGAMSAELYHAYNAMTTVTPLGAFNLAVKGANIALMLASIFTGGGGQGVSAQIQQLYERLDEFYKDVMKQFADIKKMLGEFYKVLLEIKQHIGELRQLTENGLSRLSDQVSALQQSIQLLPAIQAQFIAFDNEKSIIKTKLTITPDFVSEQEMLTASLTFLTWGVTHATTLYALTYNGVTTFDSRYVCQVLEKNDANICVGFLNNYLKAKYNADPTLSLSQAVCNPIAFAQAIEAYRQIVAYYIAHRNQENHVSMGLTILDDSSVRAQLEAHIVQFYRTALIYYKWVRGLQSHGKVFEDLINKYQEKVSCFKEFLFRDKTQLRQKIIALSTQDPNVLAYCQDIAAAYYLMRRMIEIAFPNSIKYDPLLIGLLAGDNHFFFNDTRLKETLCNLERQYSGEANTQLLIACHYLFEDVEVGVRLLQKVMGFKQLKMRENSEICECDEVMSFLMRDFVNVSKETFKLDLAKKFDLEGVDQVPIPAVEIVQSAELLQHLEFKDMKLLIGFGHQKTLSAYLEQFAVQLTIDHIKDGLFYATYLNQFQTVDLLIPHLKKRTANSLRDFISQSLLHVAAAQKAFFVIPYLIDAGLSPQEKNVEGQDPINLLDKQDHQEYQQCLKMVKLNQLGTYKAAEKCVQEHAEEKAGALFSDLLLGDGRGGVQGQLPPRWKKMITDRMHRTQNVSAIQTNPQAPVQQMTLSKVKSRVEQLPDEYDIIQGRPYCAIEENTLIYRTIKQPRRVMARDLTTMRPLRGFEADGIAISFIHPADGKNAALSYSMSKNKFLCADQRKDGVFNILIVDLESGEHRTLSIKAQRGGAREVMPYLWQETKLVYCEAAPNDSYKIKIYDIDQQSEIAAFSPSKLQRPILWMKLVDNHLLIDHCGHAPPPPYPTLEVVDLSSQTLLQTIEHFGNFGRVTQNMDERRSLFYALAIGKNIGEIHAWNYLTGKIEKMFPTNAGKFDLNTRPCFFLNKELNRLIFYKLRQNQVQVWDTNSATLLSEVSFKLPEQPSNILRWTALNGAVYALPQSPDGSGRKIFHDVTTGQALPQFPLLFTKVLETSNNILVLSKLHENNQDLHVQIYKVQDVVPSLSQAPTTAIPADTLRKNITEGALVNVLEKPIQHGENIEVFNEYLIHATLQHNLIVRDLLDEGNILPMYAPNGIQLPQRQHAQNYFKIKNNYLICCNVLISGPRGSSSDTISYKVTLFNLQGKGNALHATGQCAFQGPIHRFDTFDIWGDSRVIIAQQMGASEEINIFQLQNGVKQEPLKLAYHYGVLWMRETKNMLLVAHPGHDFEPNCLEVIDLKARQSLQRIQLRFANDAHRCEINMFDEEKQLWYGFGVDQGVYAWNYLTGEKVKDFPVRQFTGVEIKQHALQFFQHRGLRQLTLFDRAKDSVQIWDTDTIHMLYQCQLHWTESLSAYQHVLFSGLLLRLIDKEKFTVYDTASGKSLPQFSSWSDLLPRSRNFKGSYDNMLATIKIDANGRDSHIEVWRLGSKLNMQATVSKQAATASASGYGLFSVSAKTASIHEGICADLQNYQFNIQKISPKKMVVQCVSTAVAHTPAQRERVLNDYTKKLEADILASGLSSDTFQLTKTNEFELTIRGNSETITQVSNLLYDLKNRIEHPGALNVAVTDFFAGALPAPARSVEANYRCSIQ